ncbi:hypothetical protein EJB05_49671, partial [Eragrostis curvula]
MATPVARAPLPRAPLRPAPAVRLPAARRHLRAAAVASGEGAAGPALRTCKNCKRQYDPAANHPSACRFHTAHFGAEEKQGENSRVCMLGGPWILPIQAKCSNIGIVVGQKIHLMQAVLLPLTVHTMIENLMQRGRIHDRPGNNNRESTYLFTAGPGRAVAAAGDEERRACDEEVVVSRDPAPHLPPDAAVDLDLEDEVARLAVLRERASVFLAPAGVDISTTRVRGGRAVSGEVVRVRLGEVQIGGTGMDWQAKEDLAREVPALACVRTHPTRDPAAPSSPEDEAYKGAEVASSASEHGTFLSPREATLRASLGCCGGFCANVASWRRG